MIFKANDIVPTEIDVETKIADENFVTRSLKILNVSALNDDVKSVVASITSNTAAAFLKQNKFKSSIEFCDLTLKFEPSNIKALYRKSTSLLKLDRLEEATQLCKVLLRQDGNNKEAQKLMMTLKIAVEKKNSINEQAMSMVTGIEKDIDANVSLDEASFEKHENHLKQLLGSLIDDEILANALCARDLCKKLWKIKTKFPFSVRLLRKLVDYSRCKPFIFQVFKFQEVDELLKAEGENQYSGSELGALLQTYVYLQLENSLPHSSSKEQRQARVLEVCLQGLSSSVDLRKYSVESLVRVLTGEEAKLMSQKFVKECNGLDVLLNVLSPPKRTAEEMKSVKEEEDLKALRLKVQQVAIILGRVLPSLDEDELIKKHGIAFTLPALKSDNVFEQIKGCSALLAVLIANLELGVALVLETDETLLTLLLDLAKSAPAKTQGLICEIFAQLANNEKGRSTMKADDRFKITLNLLVHSDTINVKTNAAVTLAKLNATKFDKESDQGVVVLSSVSNLLKEKATEEEKAKGVEAVSYVITDRDVKVMLCETKDGLKLLDTLTELATRDKSVATSPYAYGLAYIFENLTMSEDDKRREKLREMEVTQEQWEQFQKITKTQTDGHKPDPQENVDKRIKTLMEHNGAAALRALVLNGGSARVRASIARSYANCAVLQEARGRMFSQGAARALIDLTHEKEVVEIEAKKSRFEEKEQRERLSDTKKLAAHALAKMFITTDPNLVGFNVVLDSLKCLVDNLKHCGDEDLIVFETCMALTNLSTVSHDAKRRIISLGAITQLEYASYNDDLLVRRSACECLSNLVPEKETIEWFTTANHMKLWIMFAGAYEEDLKTSEACLGALAGICTYPEIASALEREEKGLPSLIVLLLSKEVSLIHRVCVCFLGLLESLEVNISLTLTYF